MIRLARYALALAASSATAWQVGYVSPPLPYPRTPVTVAAIPGPTVPDSIEATLLMDADVLAGVAKAEDPAAAAAVQWVVLNRAGCEFLEGSVYECRRSLVEVVTEGRAFGTVIAGQYHRSWWPGRTWRREADREQLAEVQGTAVAVLLGYVPDPTDGATHFHRLGTWTPPWAPPRETWQVHGSHAFYKSR